MSDATLQDLSSIAAQHALLALAVQAREAGDGGEQARLVGRLLREVSPAGLAPLVNEVGARWLDSFRDDVPIMTVVIVEGGLEEAVDALKADDLPGALQHLAEAVAYHPKAGQPDLGLIAFYEGTQAEPGPEPELEPEPEVSEAPELEPEPESEAPPVAEDAAWSAAPEALRPLPTDDWVSRGFESLSHDFARALDCFERAIDRAPHVTEAWTGMGRALTGLGREGEAIAAFEHVLKVLPTNADAWTDYADALAHFGRRDAARFAYTQALAMDAGSERALRGRDQLDTPPPPADPNAEAARHFHDGRYQEALALVAEAKDVRGTWLRAASLLNLGRAADAFTLFRALPNEVDDIWIERGLCLDRLGRPAEARACYERANPASPRRWCHLGRHDAAHARECFARALQGFNALEQQAPLDQRMAREKAFVQSRLAAPAAQPAT